MSAVRLAGVLSWRTITEQDIGCASHRLQVGWPHTEGCFTAMMQCQTLGNRADKAFIRPAVDYYQPPCYAELPVTRRCTPAVSL